MRTNALPAQCERQIDIARYAPYRIILCPHNVAPGAHFCTFHQTHQLRGGIMLPITRETAHDNK